MFTLVLHVAVRTYINNVLTNCSLLWTLCTSLCGCTVAVCYSYVQGVKDNIFNANQGAVTTRNLQNVKDKHAAQPAKERVTPCRICVLSVLNCHGWKQLKQHNFILIFLTK